jgi:hypothetical protein
MYAEIQLHSAFAGRATLRMYRRSLRLIERFLATVSLECVMKCKVGDFLFLRGLAAWGCR